MVCSFAEMAVTKARIEKNLQVIRERIGEACSRAGRRQEEVRIVAITKQVDLETLKNLLELGHSDIGESRVQQLAQRVEEIDSYLQRKRNTPPERPRWHLVGTLQRNKISAALASADVIHSLDSLRLAEDVNARAERAGRRADVLLQVNCSQEPQKHGVAVGAALHLAELVCTLEHVRLLGLMTMAPLAADPERARPTFVRLRELFEEMCGAKIGAPNFRHLSMGMSQDYTVAVEEGATMLRIGTALFE